MSTLRTEMFTSVSYTRRRMTGKVVAKRGKDHCVDDIRQALMCHADTSILTYTWRANWRRPWPKFSVDHTCVDWNTLDSWAADRSFSAFDQISLVHPNLGRFHPIFKCYLVDFPRLI